MALENDTKEHAAFRRLGQEEKEQFLHQLSEMCYGDATDADIFAFIK